MIAVKKIIEDSDISIIQMKEYNQNELDEAKLIFCKYKSDGIIVNCNFEDSIWFLNNESRILKMTINFNETVFKSESHSRNIGEYIDFINAIKVYLLYKIDKRVITSLYTILINLIHIFNESNFFNIKFIKDFKRNDKGKEYYEKLPYILEFLEFYEMDIDPKYTELFYKQYEKYIEKSKAFSNNQRELGNLESIFKLGDIIGEFWDDSSIEEKEEFYPIKLWWEITTIFPSRVTEFIVTPYDCIDQINGKCSISLRKSNLKGGKRKKVTHKVDSDYDISTFETSENIYNLINEYYQIVDDYDFDQSFFENKKVDNKRRKYMLSYRAYFKHIRNYGSKCAAIKKSYSLDYLGIGNLTALLNKFYKNIVVEKYHFKLIEKCYKNELHNDEIELISLMDTRHYAFINLVLNDFEPMIIKKISGHHSIESSYHYYDHVKRFVKCYTYSMAKRIAKENDKRVKIETIQLNNNHIKEADILFKKVFNMKSENDIDVKDGKCSSKQDDTYIDCRKVDNNCEICKKFKPNRNSEQYIIDRIKSNEKQIDDEIEELKNIIQNYKKISNLDEAYALQINKIKSYANQNSYLISRYIL